MYQGHLNDGSSIQKHSAGALYPYVIQFRGEALVPELRHPTGEITQHASYDEACDVARQLLDLAPAAKVCGISKSELVRFVCDPHTGRDYVQLASVRGIANLIKSFGQRVTRADRVFH
jgi:hypothetical protein